MQNEDQQMLDWIKRAATEREAELRSMASQMYDGAKAEARQWAHEQLERQIAAGLQQSPAERAKEALQNLGTVSPAEKFMSNLPPHLDQNMKRHLAGMAVAEGGAARLHAKGEWNEQKMRDFQAASVEETIKEMSPEMYRRAREDGSLERALELTKEAGNRSSRESAEYRRGLMNEIVRDTYDTASDQGLISDDQYIDGLEANRLLKYVDHNGERIDQADVISAELFAEREAKRLGVEYDPGMSILNDRIQEREAAAKLGLVQYTRPGEVSEEAARRWRNPPKEVSQPTRPDVISEEEARNWRASRGYAADHPDDLRRAGHHLRTDSYDARALRQLENAQEALVKAKFDASEAKQMVADACEAVEGEARQAAGSITGKESVETYRYKRSAMDAVANQGKPFVQSSERLGSILSKATETPTQGN
jgi:hypothetical protein